MKIIVDSLQTQNTIAALCAAACKTGDLNIAKAAVIVAEAIEIEKPKKPEKANAK